MADTEQTGAAGNQPGVGDTVRGIAANEVGGAMRNELDAGRDAAGSASAAGAASDTARQGLQDAAARQSRFVQGAAEEMEKTGRGLAGMVEEAAAGMRSLMGPPGANAGNFHEAQQAMSKLVEGVMATNMRLADELMRRTGPSAVVDLQRRFVREYFEALAQGGTMLLRVARQAAEESLRPQDGAQDQGGGTVADVMTRDVAVASPDDTVQQAAQRMSEQDIGALPVGENDRLVGMVTDRDLAVRAVAVGKDPAKTKLREVMSGEPRYVFEDEPVEKAAAAMAEQRVRRLPVLSRDKRLVGMVSVGDLAAGAGAGAAGKALEGVSRPGGPHNQSAGGA